MPKRPSLRDRAEWELMAYKNAAFDALRDTSAAQEGVHILYSTDFNVLYPYMWRTMIRHNKDRHIEEDFYDYVGNTLFSLEHLYRNTSGFTIVFSDLTLIEIIESISHRFDQYNDVLADKARAGDVFSSIKRSFSDFESMMKIDPDEALGHLRKITINLSNGAIKDAATKVLELFDSNTVQMLSKCVDSSVISEAVSRSRDNSEIIVNKIRKSRILKETRTHDHAQLHYQVDAYNILVAKFVNEMIDESRLSFVGKRNARQFANDVSHDFTRNPLSPFLKLVSLRNASDQADIRAESIEWLSQVYEEARLRLERLKNVKSLNELTPNAITFIDRFYRDYVRNIISYEEVRIELDMERNRVSNIIESEASFLEHFDEARQDARNAGKKIAKLRPELSSNEVLEEYDLADNPHLASVFRKLGLTI